MMRSLSNDTFFYIKRTSTANVAEKESIPVAIPHRSTRARATKSTPVSKAAPKAAHHRHHRRRHHHHRRRHHHPVFLCIFAIFVRIFCLYCRYGPNYTHNIMFCECKSIIWCLSFLMAPFLCNMDVYSHCYGAYRVARMNLSFLFLKVTIFTTYPIASLTDYKQPNNTK